MSDVLKKFVADVDRATTAKQIKQIGRIMAGHFDQERAALLSQLRAQKARIEWQPIETAPKDGTPVLGGWLGSSERVIVTWLENGWVSVPGMYVKWPSQWQPLPAPPSSPPSSAASHPSTTPRESEKP